MCGIAGHQGPLPLPKERVDACLETMQRRGPDGNGVAAFNHGGRATTLIHSRLAIVDLDERAAQPMNLDGDTICYNGELYNHVEVREAMDAGRQPFGSIPRTWHTESDTEVLLQGLKAAGLEALDEFEGMWAFAWFNEQDGSLVLCRDRFGEKPLYVFRDGDDLYFASEIKAIVAMRGAPLPVDSDALRRYLVNGYKSLYKGPHEFFRGLEQVAPGTYWVLRGGKQEVHRYWRPRFEPDDTMSFEDAVDGVRERLLEAVRIRLRADVPVAFCMSGGVDSNALICTAKRVHEHDVHGFTIVSPDERYNESENVATVVNELQLKHTAVPLTFDDFLTNLRTLVRYHDAPVITISYYVHWLLMRGVREHGYKVVLSGTGADELFTGYYDHHLAFLHQLGTANPLRDGAQKNWTTHIAPLVRNPHLQRPELFDEDPNFRDHIYMDRQRFAELLVEPFDEPFEEEEYCSDLLRNRMLNELFHESVPVILHEDDLNAMFHSIENRSPFLDRHLCEFAYTIPTRHLIQDGRTKAVLREATKGLIPDSVRLDRRKIGFNANILDLLNVRDPDVREAVLAPSPIFEIVRREAIATMLDEKQLPNSASKFLFYFLSAKMFLEEHGAQGEVAH